MASPMPRGHLMAKQWRAELKLEQLLYGMRRLEMSFGVFMDIEMP
jgi:hypothetical protein